MNIVVETPLTIRGDALAFESSLDAVDISLRRALWEALSRSGRAVPRAAHDAVKFVAPTIDWQGQDVGGVTTETRNAVAEMITSALADMAKTLPEYDGTAVTPILTDRIEERRDDLRDLGLADAYILDSYGGPQEVVPVERAIEVPRYVEHLSWRPTNSLPELLRYLRLCVKNYAVPDTEMVGVIAREPNGEMVVVLRIAGPVVIDRLIPITAPRAPKVVGSGLTAELTFERVEMSAEESYELRYVSPVSGAEARRGIIVDTYGPRLKQMILGHATRESHRVDQGDIDKQIQKKVDQLADQLAAEFPTAKHAFALTVGGQENLLFADADLGRFSGQLFRYVQSRGSWETKGDAKQDGRSGTGDGASADDGAGSPGGGDDLTPGTGSSQYDTPPEVLSQWRREKHTGVCAPFRSEPSLVELGSAGEPLRALIARIAAMLQIRECGYAGNFAIGAAGTLLSRAIDVREAAGHKVGAANSPDGSSPGGPGSSIFEFASTTSPAVQALRQLASVVPLLSELRTKISDTYLDYANSTGWPPDRTVVRWLGDFALALQPPFKQGIGMMFVAACRSILVDQLDRSYQAIVARLGADRFDAYAEFFRSLVIGRAASLHQLERLHNRLRDEVGTGSVAAIAIGAFTTWQDARRGVTDLVDGYATGKDAGDGDLPGTLMRRGSELAIRDDDLRIWTLRELESEMAFQRRLMQDIDPLVAQIDTEQLLGRFRADPSSINRSLHQLLIEMRDTNRDTAEKVTSDWSYAFSVSSIRSSGGEQATVPGSGYQLGGIHLEAHRQIGHFFGGDVMYALGVKSLFDQEEVFSTVKTVAEWAAVMVLAIYCPPLGTALGAALAAYHAHEAFERADVQRSLLTPELVASRAEIEVELFATQLGLALAIIPEVGTIARGIVGTGRSIIREGVAEGAGLAVRAAQRALLVAVEKQLAAGLERVIVAAIVADRVVDQVLQLTLGAVMKEVYGEAERQTSTVDESTPLTDSLDPGWVVDDPRRTAPTKPELPPGGIPDTGPSDGGAPYFVPDDAGAP